MIVRMYRCEKGYEIYSWKEDEQWNFTLITGTNRNKTSEEIVREEDYISESGWVNVHVTGLDAVKDYAQQCGLELLVDQFGQ